MVTVIIDDEQTAARHLAERLKRYDDVTVAGVADNGLDGLALINRHKPDLLFLDVQLPDINGLDFLERMDEFTDGNCRVVMYTAYDKFVLPAFRKKAFDVLLKPFADDELDTVMRRVAEDNAGDAAGNEAKDTDRLLFYTNMVDFKLVHKCDIALFQYNHDIRCWEIVVAKSQNPIRLKRNVKSDDLLKLDDSFVQVNQKFIINVNFLVEVVDNVCRFYPPFDRLDYVKVGRAFRRRLINRFCNL